MAACNTSGITFDPYTNKPLRLEYCIPGTPDNNTPCPSSNTPAIVVAKATPLGETDLQCLSTNCFLYDYQASGMHGMTWYGYGTGGTFIGDAGGVTVIRRTDIWPRNMTLLYGSAPAISNLTISAPVFNPASAPMILAKGEVFTMTVSSPLSRSVSLKAQFRNTVSNSVLRTITTAPQSAGGTFEVDWDGRADNGAWVSPDVYEVIITVTDSAGSTAVIKPLMMVRYE
jgi:hypothetical protein